MKSNKCSSENSVSCGASAQTPGVIRIGTSALTSRDMLEDDIKVVAEFLHRSVQIALTLQKEAGTKMLKDFIHVAKTEQPGKGVLKQVQDLRREVRNFAKKWPLPGVDISGLQRPRGIEEDE